MAKEKPLTNQILLELTGKDTKLFRNNTGQAFQGVPSYRGNTVLLENFRIIKFGLITGASDIIGWKNVTITQEMVGQQLAVFTAIEVKTKNTSRKSHQKTFIKNLKEDGGFCGFANTIEDAKSILNEQ